MAHLFSIPFSAGEIVTNH